MVIAAVLLFKKLRDRQATTTSVVMFTATAAYPLIAGGSIEHVGFGYVVTLLLTAPIATLLFINWTHRKLAAHGGAAAVWANVKQRISQRTAPQQTPP